MAAERVAREQAAADLRQLRNLAAVAGLIHGGDDGRRAFREYEAELMRRASGEMEETAEKNRAA